MSCFIPRQHVFLIPHTGLSSQSAWLSGNSQQSNRRPLTHSCTFPHPQINHLDGLTCVVSYRFYLHDVSCYMYFYISCHLRCFLEREIAELRNREGASNLQVNSSQHLSGASVKGNWVLLRQETWPAPAGSWNLCGEAIYCCVIEVLWPDSHVKYFAAWVFQGCFGFVLFLPLSGQPTPPHFLEHLLLRGS